jgi:hypothetical protein
MMVLRLWAALVVIWQIYATTAFSAQTSWIEATYAHYSVFYQAGFEEDAAFTHTWADRVEQLMKDKYGVVPNHHRMSFYLHPAPTAGADVETARNRCCTRGTGGVSTGTIDLLAPSAPIWRRVSAISSLGMPKNDESYHAKVLMSEYIPIGHFEVQASRPAGGWQYYDGPNWFVQGLQEYDAILHTTPVNRDVTAKQLLVWAAQHQEVFRCCDTGLTIADDYNGGAAFMAFLAAEYGESIHAALLRNPAATFDAALTDVTRRSRTELFAKFREWLAAMK